MKQFEIYLPFARNYQTIEFAASLSSKYDVKNADQDAQKIADFFENLILNLPMATEDALRKNPKFRELTGLDKKLDSTP